MRVDISEGQLQRFVNPQSSAVEQTDKRADAGRANGTAECKLQDGAHQIGRLPRFDTAEADLGRMPRDNIFTQEYTAWGPGMQIAGKLTQ